ncbi:MAG: T9SS type A sorting domain-containing protein [Calditrichaeota bacterium]|nr:T9SS type A sorting domain-containing protein [Calditrichota bacterium]
MMGVATRIIGVLLVLCAFLFAQDYVAEGYTKIFERNQFETAPHWPIVADEVHAGFDLDKDGNLEFIVLADHSNPNSANLGQWADGHSIYVYEWSPTNNTFELMWSWSDTTLKTGGASFPTMAVADLDGDGNQEIVFGIPHAANNPAPDVSPTVIYIFEFENGLPTEPTAKWTALAKPGTNTRPSAMAAGDIDGDGQMEVAVAFRKYSSASTDDALMIFSLNGPFLGDFTQFKVEMIDTTGDWGSVYACDITDLDNDGFKEAYFSTGVHTVYEATGPDSYTLSYVENPSFSSWSIQATAEGDIDGDGKTELIFGKTNGALGLWYNISDVANTDSTNEALIKVVEPAGCRGLTVGDYDGDGKTDIFMGGNYGGSVWRIEYKGTGDITDSTSYTYELVYLDTIPSGGTRVYSVSFPGDNFSIKHGGTSSTDMNGNGEPEVVFVFEDGDSTQSWVVMLEGTGVTAINLEAGKQVLESYQLFQNYPNPFNPSTTIKYRISQAGEIKLVIYDMLGREVKTLVKGFKSAGTYEVVWDGTDNFGRKVGSGTYIYMLKFGDKQISRKMTLMK